MLRVTTDDLEKLHKTLKDLTGGKALPYAAKESLNTSAFAVRRTWKKRGEKSMIVRNKWTFKGSKHRVVKARAQKSIEQMEAVTGNVHRYMAEQEHGVVKARARGLQIPEPEARIGDSILRTVRRQHWRKGSHMRFPSKTYRYRDSDFYGSARRAHARARPRGSKRGRISQTLGYNTSSGKKRYIAAVLRMAREQGANHVFLDFGGGDKGIYKVGTTSRKTGKVRYHKKLVRVWDMRRKVTRTRPNPMLKRTIEELTPYFPEYHRISLENEIRKYLKYRGFHATGPNIYGLVAKFKQLQAG